MSEIVTRWEWRIFARRLRAAEAWLAKHASTGVQESDEIYFLSGSGGVAKLRHGLLDIKVLREVDRDGLERWEPVLKAPFPVVAEDARDVFRHLGLEGPAVPRARWTVEEFTSDFAGPGGPLRAVEVRKRRVRYAIEGCALELTDVTANGRPARTLAVESEEAAAVVALVRAMKHDGWVNTCYPSGLAALLDDAPERYAVLDVGTNSVKFHVAERGGDGGWRRVVDRAEVTRLGEGLEESGSIAEAAARRTAAALRAMVEEARGSGVRAIAAVGTAGLRSAANRAAVLEIVHAAAGIRVEVIPGEEEARLAFLATAAALPGTPGTLAVVDTGGGSTQFSFGRGLEVEERFSLDVGAVRYTERFRLDRQVSPEALRGLRESIAADLSPLDGRPAPDRLVAMGGAATNLTAVRLGLRAYDPDRVQGAVLDRVEIDRQIELYRSRDAAARRSIVGLQAARAEVILAGACILRTVMEKLGGLELTVSDRGLRHGVLAERFH